MKAERTVSLGNGKAHAQSTRLAHFACNPPLGSEQKRHERVTPTSSSRTGYVRGVVERQGRAVGMDLDGETLAT